MAAEVEPADTSRAGGENGWQRSNQRCRCQWATGQAEQPQGSIQAAASLPTSCKQHQANSRHFGLGAGAGCGGGGDGRRRGGRPSPPPPPASETPCDAKSRHRSVLPIVQGRGGAAEEHTCDCKCDAAWRHWQRRRRAAASGRLVGSLPPRPSPPPPSCWAASITHAVTTQGAAPGAAFERPTQPR